jgi:hypothetical protein
MQVAEAADSKLVEPEVQVAEETEDQVIVQVLRELQTLEVAQEVAAVLQDQVLQVVLVLLLLNLINLLVVQ